MSNFFNRLSKKPLAASLLLAGAALPLQGWAQNCIQLDIGGIYNLSGNQPTTCVIINGGTLNVTGDSSLEAVQLRSGFLIGNGNKLVTLANFDLQSGSTAVSARLEGAVGLDKTTPGTVTLDQANGYTGPTTITGGVLALVGGGGIANSSGVMNKGVFDISAAAGGVPVTSLSGNGAVTLGANTLTLTNAAGEFFGVVGGAGGLTLNAGNEVLGGANTYSGPTTVNGGTLILAGGTAIADGGAVIFGPAGTLALSANETIGSLAGPAGGQVMLNGNTLTTGDGTDTAFSGSIGAVNGGGIVKRGAGTFTLLGNTANLNAGTAVIDAGTLALAGGTATVGNTLVNNNGTFAQTDGTANLNATTINGGAFALAGGTASLVTTTINAGTFTQSGGTSNLTTANLNGGAFALTNGTASLGTTTLNAGSFTQSGGTSNLTAATLNGGAFALTNGTASLGTTNLSGGSFTQSGGTSNLTTANLNGGAFALTNGTASLGTTTLNAGSFTQSGGTSNLNTATINGGAFALTNGTASLGTTSLSAGSLTQSGGTSNLNTATINGGAFALTNGTASLGTTTLNNTGSFAQSGGNATLKTTIINSGTFTQSGGTANLGTTTIRGGSFTQSGGTSNLTTTHINGGAFALTNGTASLGTTTLNAGSFTQSGGTSSLTTANLNGGAFALTNGTASLGTATLSAGSFTQTGGNANLNAATVNGGTLTLTGGSTRLDSVAINGNGLLMLAGTGGASGLGAVADDGRFDMANAAGGVSVQTLSGNGTVALGANTLTLTNAAGSFSGVISGAGGLALNGGSETLGGANTYTGTTTVNGGTLSLAGGNAIADTAAVVVGPAGTLNVANNETVGSLSTAAGSQTLLNGSSLSTASAHLSGGQVGGSGNLGINSGGAGLLVDGSVTLGGGVTLANAGNALLASGAQLGGGGSYVQTAGDTQVDGTLAVAKTELQGGVLHGAGTVSGNLVNNATVQGDGGGINLAGNVTGSGNYTGQVNVSGTFSPGQSGQPGLVTAENLSLSPTGRLVMELGGLARGSEYDAINAKTVQLGGALDVRLVNGFTPSIGNRFDLISADSITQSFDAPFACPDGYFGNCRVRNDGANVVLSFLPKNLAPVQSLEDALPNAALRRLTPLLFQPGGLAQYHYALQQISPRQDYALSELATLTAKLQTNNITRHLMGERAKRYGQPSSAGPVSLNINGRNLPTQWGPATGGAAGDDEAFFNGKFGGFVNAQFEFDDRATTVQQRGYHSNLYGFTAGVDYWVNPSLLLGLAAVYNYTDSRLANDGGAQYINGYGATGFASLYLADHWYVDLMANGTYNEFSSQRNIRYTDAVGRVNTTAYGRANGLQSHYSVNTGYDFPLQEWTLGLRGRAEYVNTPLDAYQETGAALNLNLAYKQRSLDSLVSALGGIISHTASTEVGVFTSQLVLEWEHQYMNSSQLTGTRFADNLGVQFNTPVDGNNRDYFNIRSSVSAQFANGASAFIQYDTTVGLQNFTRHAVNLGVRMEF